MMLLQAIQPSRSYRCNDICNLLQNNIANNQLESQSWKHVLWIEMLGINACNKIEASAAVGTRMRFQPNCWSSWLCAWDETQNANL